MSHNPQHTVGPKHRDDWQPVDAHSRALILPPVHPVTPVPGEESWSIVAGRHREWGRNAGTIVEEVLSRHPKNTGVSYLRSAHFSERGSAQWGAVVILSMFATFLLALTMVTK